MRGVEQRSDPGEIAAIEHVHGGADAGVLRDHMRRRAADVVGPGVGEAADVAGSECGERQCSIGSVDRGTAFGVAAVAECMRMPGVEQEQGEIVVGRVKGDLTARSRVGVEEQRVTVRAEQRGGVVHRAARHAGDDVLGTAPQRGERGAVETEGVEVVEGEQRGGHEGRGGGQPGSDGDVGGQGEVEAGYVVARLAQSPRGTREVGRPPGR